MINEGLEGFGLPPIINTKIMETITINAKAQETYGRFMRDWAWNWAGERWTQMVQYINMGHPRTKRLFKGIFFQLYENAGGTKDDLMARKDYYAFTETAWREHLGNINLAYNEKRRTKWKKDLVRKLGPGEGNNIDPEILDKALEEFGKYKDFMQESGSRLYSLVSNEGPREDAQSKSANMSYLWSEVRRIMKSVKKYIKKRKLPRIGEFLEANERSKYLNLFIFANRGRSVTKLRKYLNEDENNWVGIQKLLKDPGTGFKDSMDAVYDFVEKAKYRVAYDTMCSDVGEGELAPKGKPCIIKKYDDGYFWFSRGAKSCELFGQEGRNCGQGKYTLIDLQKSTKREKGQKRLWRIGLDYDVKQQTLHQILSAGNQFPNSRFWPYIKDFIETYDVKEINNQAFEYFNTDGDDVDKDEMALDFVMAVGNESVKSRWLGKEQEKKSMADDIVADLMDRTIPQGGADEYQDHPDVLRWTGADEMIQQRSIATAARYLRRLLYTFEQNMQQGIGMDGLTDVNKAEANAIVHVHTMHRLRLTQQQIVLYRQFVTAVDDGPTPEEQAWRPGMPTPANEAVNRWKRNLNYQPPKEVDAKKTHAVQSWYKNKRNKIK
jgi:hypothetical protein